MGAKKLRWQDNFGDTRKDFDGSKAFIRLRSRLFPVLTSPLDLRNTP
jgi:hypothetical protein